jgi:lipopolysaccharide transport system permease protein
MVSMNEEVEAGPKAAQWDLVITGKKNLVALQLNDIWRYRDLLYMMVKRDIAVTYKQTILGPLWFFLQPILTATVYVVVFSRIAGLSTNGMPPVLFYLSGTIIWSYFADCFNSTSSTFVQNAGLFGKVYFPRIVVPISKVVSGLLKFLIQFLLFFAMYVLYWARGYELHPTSALFYLPLMVLMMGVLGLGLGIFFSSLTTKYRDLVFLIQFGVQLLMYATPVIYPLSTVPEKYKVWILLNPMTPVLEGFRAAFLGAGDFQPSYLAMSCGITVVMFVVGLVVFNYTEKDFMDSV